MKRIKKKFRLRIKHFSSKYYVIQYTNYYLIPNWKNLKYWYGSGHPGGVLEGWVNKLLTFSKAEQYMERFNSIQDIKDHYGVEKVKEKRWRREEEEYWKKNIPYRIKNKEI